MSGTIFIKLTGIFTSLCGWPDKILEVKGQGHSRPLRWKRHPRWRWGIKVYLLVFKLIQSKTTYKTNKTGNGLMLYKSASQLL